jgi:hypothetical protein
VLCLGAYLSPAVKDGFSFGPSSIAEQLSVLTYLPHLVYANHLNGDIITQSVAWDQLDWLAVHHGELPLWNPYSANGMPLLLNFESAPFSLPIMIGYLFPLSASFFVAVAVKLLVAGTGAYYATRLAGGRPLVAALAGTTFMLSGSLSGWAGWAVSGPLVWAGWLMAGALLCWRPGALPRAGAEGTGRHGTGRQGTGRRYVGPVVLALSGAFAVYGGFPETLLLLAIGLGTVVVIGGTVGALRGLVQPAGVARLALGGGAGMALSAPLWLPGIAVIEQSARLNENGTGGLPLHAMALLLAQGYDGLPTTNSPWFGPADYYEATAYVGVVAVVLALYALLSGWRRPMVASLGGTVLLSLAIIYLGPSQRLFTRLGLGAIATQRMLPIVGFCAAVLAGLGAEQFLRQWRGRAARYQLSASALACGGVLVALMVSAGGDGLSAAQLSARRHALLWPLATMAVLAAIVVGTLATTARTHAASTEPRRARFSRRPGLPAGVVCGCVLVAQSAYLVFAGVGLNSYATVPYPTDHAVMTLKHLVGNALVALDGPNPGDVTLWTGTGFYPEVNIGYGLRELAVRDPVMPPAYLYTWPVAAAITNARLGNNVFAPQVGAARRARFYGAGFILAPAGRVPKNVVPVTRIPVPLVHYLVLYRVPGAQEFSFDGTASDRVLGYTQTGDATWALRTSVPATSELTLRLTYFPGWHISADGRPLAVHKADGLFVGATVPAGTRTVVLNYWPNDLTTGFALAVAAVAVLAGVVGAEEAQRLRRRRAPPASPPLRG